MKVAFVLNDLQLSGGVGVVLHHARELGTRHGFDVSLVLSHEQELESWNYDALEHVHVVSLSEARAESFDVAVCTWWETAYFLFSLTARRYAYFVQSLEDRFYRPEQLERTGAALTLGFPVAFVTEAHWIAETLGELRPDARCHVVRNGIDKAIFAGPERVTPNLDAPLRILIEGQPRAWFKHVGEAVHTAARMTAPKRITLVTSQRDAVDGLPADRVVGPVDAREMARLYADHDLVLKLSSVEGMFGPPLEGFHMGATCVVTPVTGHDEYVEHGVNGLVCDWDDPRGTARMLDLLAADRALLQTLRENALRTAREWPSWERQGEEMAGALRAIAAEPAPEPAPALAMLTRDLHRFLEAQRRVVNERNRLARRPERIRRLVHRTPVLGSLYRWWRSPWAQHHLGPRFGRLKDRLVGR